MAVRDDYSRTAAQCKEGGAWRWPLRFDKFWRPSRSVALGRPVAPQQRHELLVAQDLRPVLLRLLQLRARALARDQVVGRLGDAGPGDAAERSDARLRLRPAH